MTIGAEKPVYKFQPFVQQPVPQNVHIQQMQLKMNFDQTQQQIKSMIDKEDENWPKEPWIEAPVGYKWVLEADGKYNLHPI